MARDAAVTLAVRLHLSFDQRANFRQVPSAHAMYFAVVRRYSPSPPAVLGCLALPLTFPALSQIITVANEVGHSGADGSGGGGHQELEPSCVAACAPTSTVYAHPSTVLLCLVVPSASSGSTEGPVAADFGGPCVVGGGDAGGADSGGAASRGARSPLVGGVGGTGAGGAGSGGALQSLPRRPIFLELLRYCRNICTSRNSCSTVKYR
ncbi:unnamed protein product [Closterium sp. NIES-54]